MESKSTGTVQGSTPFFIDWISAILAHSLMGIGLGYEPMESDFIRLFYRMFGVAELKSIKPRFGYAFAFQDCEYGIVIQYHPTREDMGINVILTGSALRAFSWQLAMERLAAQNARYTRIDVSMDVHDAEFSIQELYQHWKNGACVTRATRASKVSSETGETFYVGARTSDKFLRVYDKGGQLGGLQGEHFRIEMECKGAAANFVGGQLLSGIDDVARRCIPAFFDAPLHQAWCRAMETSLASILIPSDKKRSDTEGWLMGTVLDCMVEVERRRPGFLHDFHEEVMHKVLLELQLDENLENDNII